MTLVQRSTTTLEAVKIRLRLQQQQVKAISP